MIFFVGASHHIPMITIHIFTHLIHTHYWAPHSLICSTAPEIRLYFTWSKTMSYGHEKSDKTSKTKKIENFQLEE